MKEFYEISPFELTADESFGNVFSAVAKDWMLICACDENGKANAMTASWGFFGNMWNKPSAVCFIRPQRFTYSLTESADRFSLCFFGGEMREELRYFGTKSGRDRDKAADCGLHYTELGGVSALEEAKLIFVCKKAYVDDIRPQNFVDTTIDGAVYPTKDYHRMYICEIEKCFAQKK